MFNWFYNGLARSILRQIDNPLVAEKVQQLILETLQDPEVLTQLTMTTDALYDRYKKKTLGTLGTMQQKANKATQQPFANLIGKNGQINVGGILSSFLLRPKTEKKTSILP